jgi:hypothetical protein
MSEAPQSVEARIKDSLPAILAALVLKSLHDRLKYLDEKCAALEKDVTALKNRQSQATEPGRGICS